MRIPRTRNHSGVVAGLVSGSLVSLVVFLIAFPVTAAEPTFGWAVSAGGAGDDVASSVAVDSSGNVYTTGAFSGTVDFDPGPAVVNLISAGGLDVYVQKLDSDGNLVWAVAMGGTGQDVGSGVAVDGSGNVHTTGSFWGTADFDPGPAVFNLVNVGAGNDVFVQKLDSSGSLVWAGSMGGGGSDVGMGIALDAAGNVHTTGRFQSDMVVDFDPGPGVFNLVGPGFGENMFVQKLDSDGNLLWAVGGPDGGNDIAVDESGNVYTTGGFVGTADFDPGPGVFNLSSGSPLENAFVQKLDAAGDFVWAVSMGGGSTDIGTGVAVDASGNVYSTGYFEGSGDFDPGAGTLNLANAGGTDVYVQKLDSGGTLAWVVGVGGSSNERGVDIAVDSLGNVSTIGYYEGTVDFDPGTDPFVLTSANSSDDVFVQRLDSDGSFEWAVSMGGTSNDQGIGVVMDAASNVYSTGVFGGTADFDPGSGAFNLTSTGSFDVFVQKLSGAPADSDGDGVVDGVDECSDTPEGSPVDDFGCYRDLVVEFDRSIAPSSIFGTESIDLAVDVTNVGQGELATSRLLVLLPEGFEVTNPPSATQGTCQVFENLVDCLLGEVAAAGAVGAAFGFTAPCTEMTQQIELEASVIATDDLNPVNDVDVLLIEHQGPCTEFEVTVSVSGPSIPEDPAEEAFVDVAIEVLDGGTAVFGVPVNAVGGVFGVSPTVLGSTDIEGSLAVRLPVAPIDEVVYASFDATGLRGTGAVTAEIYRGSLTQRCATAPASLSDFLVGIHPANVGQAITLALLDFFAEVLEFTIGGEELVTWDVFEMSHGEKKPYVYAVRATTALDGEIEGTSQFFTAKKSHEAIKNIKKLQKQNPLACGLPA